MCILIFYVNPNPEPNEFKLILVNIRDEFYTRPTKKAEFWSNNAGVISGLDLEPGKEGGTWLAINDNGKIGSLLNVLQQDKDILPDKKGRGFLVVDYVKDDADPVAYLNHINTSRSDYNGFVLVTLDLRLTCKPCISYISNGTIDKSDSPNFIEPGIHAFGNSITPASPWPKVKKAKEKFTKVVNEFGFPSNKEILVEQLFDILNDKTCYGMDESMKLQGKGKSQQFMKKLSAIFVEVPESNYGSRCHTVILIDSSGMVDYYERNREEITNSTKEWSRNHITFPLKSRQ